MNMTGSVATERDERVAQILATSITREQLAEAMWCAEDTIRRRDDYEAWLRMELDELRSEDRTEVVRCRDCGHAYLDHGAHVCNFRPLLAHYVGGDEFCSNGEVKDA